MRRFNRVWGWIAASWLWAAFGHAATFDPLVFSSLGTVNATEAISINTDTLQLTGGASYTGVLDSVSGAGIFAFDDITGANLSIFGSRTLGLLSRGNIAFTGTIDLLGTGGLEIGAVGSLAMKGLSAQGSGGGIQLHASQITFSEPITWSNRSLSITSSGDIIFLGGTGAVPIPVVSPGSVTLVPVPSSIVLFSTGLGILSLILKRRRLALCREPSPLSSSRSNRRSDMSRVLTIFFSIGVVLFSGMPNACAVEFTYMLVDVPGALLTGLTGINNAGQVVGGSQLPAQAFVGSGGTFIPLSFSEGTSTSALDINNNGHVVGSYFDGINPAQGFRYGGTT